jgi:hypothetical protein
MFITIEVTKLELAAAMAYTNEIEKFKSAIESALGKKSSFKPVEIPTSSAGNKNKMYEFVVNISPGGLKATLTIWPEFVSDVLTMYAKAFNTVAVPCASFVVALMICFKQIEGDAEATMAKWVSEPKARRIRTKKAA